MQEETICDLVTEEDLLQGAHVQWRHDSTKTLYLCDVKIDRFAGPIWYCFAEVDKPGIVWCEIREEEFELMKLVSEPLAKGRDHTLGSRCAQYREEQKPRKVLVVGDTSQRVHRLVAMAGMMAMASSATADAFDPFPNIDIMDSCDFRDIEKKKAAWKSPFPTGRRTHKQNSRRKR